MSSETRNKKPLWITPAAHARLKFLERLQGRQRRMGDIASQIILAYDPDQRVSVAETRVEEKASEPIAVVRLEPVKRKELPPEPPSSVDDLLSRPPFWAGRETA